MPTTRRRQELNKALEELHLAFRAVVARPDAMLARHHLSRIHHRILYFIGRNPRSSVNDLLSALAISKQALHGPLRQLVERKFVVALTDDMDRRIKRLQLTERGVALEDALSSDQRERFARAFREAGSAKEAAWREVMLLLMRD